MPDALVLAKGQLHLLDVNGRNALQWAGGKGQPNTTADAIQQHAPPPPLASVAAAPRVQGRGEPCCPTAECLVFVLRRNYGTSCY